jgi:hypothetical protein
MSQIKSILTKRNESILMKIRSEQVTRSCQLLVYVVCCSVSRVWKCRKVKSIQEGDIEFKPYVNIIVYLQRSCVMKGMKATLRSEDIDGRAGDNFQNRAYCNI